MNAETKRYTTPYPENTGLRLPDGEEPSAVVEASESCTGLKRPSSHWLSNLKAGTAKMVYMRVKLWPFRRTENV